MAVGDPLDLSDWAEILTMRRFYHACWNAAWKIGLFELLTHHYMARHTLKNSTSSWFDERNLAWQKISCFSTLWYSISHLFVQIFREIDIFCHSDITWNWIWWFQHFTMLKVLNFHINEFVQSLRAEIYVPKIEI